ncbi:MAG: lactate utilization protein [Candidatus Bathyarchaeia archaeon]
MRAEAGSSGEAALNGVAEALERRGFKAFVARDRGEALGKVLELIPKGANVGIGGSLTVREVGIPEALEARGCRIVQHWIPGIPPERDMALRREALTTDFYLTSANAITEDGLIVNMDAVGNRTSAMAFGPSNVIIVAGLNKIVKDLNGAIERIRNIAAPLNASRLKRNVPCAKEGKCVDIREGCDSPERICRVMTIFERRPARTNVFVVLIGEALGC